MSEDFRQLLEEKANYMASNRDYDRCSKVIIGIPMDATTSFRPGTRLAPYRVREVSESIEEYSVYQDKSLEELDFYDAGDMIIPFGNVGESLRPGRFACFRKAGRGVDARRRRHRRRHARVPRRGPVAAEVPARRAAHRPCRGRRRAVLGHHRRLGRRRDGIRTRHDGRDIMRPDAKELP